MKRVLAIAASAKPGGAERALAELARALPAEGWHVSSVLLEHGPLEDWLDDVTVIEAGRTRNVARTASTVRTLARLARDSDIVVSSQSKTHVYGGAAAALAGKPAVWWQHGIPSRNRIDTAASLLPGTAVVCASEAVASAQRRLRPQRPVAVVAHGVTRPAVRDDAIARVRSRTGTPLVGIVGRLEPWKGHELFLRAAAELARSRPDVRFAVVGGAVLGTEGDYPARLEQLAAELGIGDRVLFTGHVDDAAPWLAAFDVAVHASTAEPFGLVLLEAMASGTPIVTTGGGAASELVVNGVSGIVVRERAPAALAAAVTGVLADDELAGRLSQGGRARAAEYTWERSAERFAAVLDACVDAGRHGRVLLPRTATSPLVVGMGWFPNQTGGLNRYLRDLVAQLPEVRAVVLGPATDAPSRVTVAAKTDASLLRRLVSLRRETRAAANGVDVVDAHFALTILPSLRALRRLPLVVHFQGPWADEGAAEDASRVVVAVKRALERHVYRRARVVVTISHAFAKVAHERYGIPRERIEVIPPGIDLEQFSPGDRATARTTLDVAADGFVVVAARRLVARMGLDVLLEAFGAIQRTRANAVLLIAGDGPLRRALEDAAPPGTRFLGRIPDDELVELYRAADLAVVPSTALEGFGLAAAEALACGTPCLVTDVGGLPEVVAGLEPALVVPAGDAGALAARALGPLPDRDACRRHAERFSWQAAADGNRSAYRRAARPRVVYVDHTAQLSGGELALLRTLPQLDVDAHVVLAEAGPLVERLRSAGIRTTVLPLAPGVRNVRRTRLGTGAPSAVWSTLRYSVKLARLLRELDADVVHTNSLKAAVYGGIAGRVARVPVVWHIRDRIADDYLSRPGVALMRVAARVLPTAVIANSRATLDTLPRRPTAIVVPSPIEPDAPRTREVNGSLHVGIVGRIARWKGQHVFLEAFAKAFPEGGAHAHVVGAPLFGAEDEAYDAELRELAHHLAIDDRTTFAGFSDDVPEELARLDVLVHASTSPEPFGQVVVQGMAAGLPVVAADAGGPAEIVHDGVNGLLYPPGDSDALAATLRRLAADAPLRRTLGESGRRTAAAFTPAAAARAIESLYRSVR